MNKLGVAVTLTLVGVAPARLALGCVDSSTPASAGNPDARFDLDAHDLPSDSSAAADGATVVNECTAPTAGPTSHQGNIPTETWTAAASPHLVPYDINIDGTLTLEPCAEVLLAAGTTVSVKGALVASGSATKRVHIGAKDPTKPFVMIRSAGGTLRLSYATIDGGGDPSNIVPDLTGMLNLQGIDQTQPSQETLFVDHVTLAGSKSNGLVLRDGAGFANGSTDLTVTGSTLYPVNTWSRASGGLPNGTYTGNGHDEILIPGGGGNEGFAESTTLHDRGVPYHVGTSTTGGALRVDPLPGAATSTLTIEPGVTLRFKKGGIFQIAIFQSDLPARAALIAAGTATRPIVFTSAEAAPSSGDWLGIWFGDQPLATNIIDFARVEYAGGLSASGSSSCPYPAAAARSDAAIRIFGGPSSQFVTNTTIADSAYYGIDRGWRKDNLTDFLTSNVFTNVTNCHQSYPKDANGACPSSVPCPL